MKVVLPVSKKEMEIPVINYKDSKELRALQRQATFFGGVNTDNMDKAQELVAQRESIMERVISQHVPDMEDLPSRDVLVLIAVTYAYAMNEPIAAIKNLLAGGDGAPTSSEPTTAQTATN